MPTKVSTKAASSKIDPVAVTTAILEETPELAQPLMARNIVQDAGDGHILVSGTTQTIHDIGDYVLSFQAAQNAYLNALVNRIGFVYISSKMYTNPWSVFKKGRLEFGETIEEIFVNLCKPYQFSPSSAEQDVFKRVIPDVRAAFHTMNFQKLYPITVSDDQLRQAFLSWQGIADLIAQIVDMVYTSAQTDEYLVMKYMLARAVLNGQITPVTVPALTSDNASAVAQVMNEVSMNLEFQSDKYTMTNVTTHTPQEDQFLIVTTNFRANMNMNVLAAAFHLDYAQLMGRIINVDSLVDMDWKRLTDLFTDETGTVDSGFAQWTEDEVEILETVPAIMTSRDFWQVWDNFEKMAENYNGRGLYWNYFYHVWKTFSLSPFAQAVCYTAATGAITAVSVTPTSATLPKGADMQLAVGVSHTGVISQAVGWKMTGNASTGSYVSDNGKVHVAADETAKTLTVTATSVADPTKSGSCAVTVQSA